MSGAGTPSCLRLLHPTHKALHQCRHVLRFRRHEDDAAAGRVPDHILAIAIRRRAAAFAAHDQGMEALNQSLAQRPGLRRPRLHLRQRIPIILHLGHIPLSTLECVHAFDHLFRFFQGEAIAFDARGIVGGANPGPPS